MGEGEQQFGVGAYYARGQIIVMVVCVGGQIYLVIRTMRNTTQLVLIKRASSGYLRCYGNILADKHQRVPIPVPSHVDNPTTCLRKPELAKQDCRAQYRKRTSPNTTVCCTI